MDRNSLVALALVVGGCNFAFHASSSTSSTGTPPSQGQSQSQGSSQTSGEPASGPAQDPTVAATPAAHEAGDSPSAPPPREPPPPDPGFAKLPAPALPAGPAPSITIVSPASDEELVGASTKAPDDKFENLPCLQDAKTFGIKLAAQNWSVAPGGQGVLVVVDGVYAAVTHDLRKPIMMADLEPYERVDNNATFADEGPMYECGHHWIAAVPTAANGQMLPVAPAVSWFFNRSRDYSTRDERPVDREVRLERSLPVINWPLIGPIFIGSGWRYSHRDEEALRRSGRIATSPKRVVLDWVLARGTRPGACTFKISHQGMNNEHNDPVPLATRGTVILPDAYIREPLIVDAEECGGMSDYVAKIWAVRPAAKRAYSWPVPGSAQAEDFWHSEEGHAAFNQMSHGSSHDSGSSGGGGKCKSQCRLEAGQCRTSCRGAKCANDCNRTERQCKAGC